MRWNQRSSEGTFARKQMLPCLLALLVLLGSGYGTAQMGSGNGQDGVAMGPQGRMVRGTVAAATADGLTVKTEGGDTYRVVVTTNTRMMKERQPIKLSDIHPGDGVGAMGVIDAPIKKAREDLGKTYITGKVAAIDDVNLTIERPDGVSQKIMVDESTSFRKGSRRMRGEGFGMGEGGGQGQGLGAPTQSADPAESITLADVKVGDRVMGRGGLKGGVFVPTELVVMDAAAMGRHHGGQGSGDGAGAGAGPGAAPAATPAGPK
jgi:preprotein translocase subunit YajC